MRRQHPPSQVITASDLPAELQALVAQVVRRARLRSAERADVARELISHFAEAMAAGKTAAEAGAAFGDARASARELRAAAIAKRSAVDRAFGQAWVWGWRAVGAVVVAYACFGVYLWCNAPRITFDAIEKMQASMPKAERAEDCAWPGYRDAMIAAGFNFDQPSPSQLSAISMPGDSEWPALSAWLDARQPAMDALRAARKHAMLCYPLGVAMADEDGILFGTAARDQSRRDAEDRATDPFPGLGMLQPQLAAIHWATRALAADAMHAVERGDAGRAAEDFLAIVALSQHAQEGRLILNDLVGVNIRREGCRGIIAAMEWKPALFNDEQLAGLQEALASVPAPLQRLDMTMEAIAFDDLLQRMYTDDGAGDGWYLLDAVQVSALGSRIGGPPPQRTTAGTPTRGAVSVGSPLAASPGTPTRVAVSMGSPLAAGVVAGRKATREMWKGYADRAVAKSATGFREQDQDCIVCELERLRQNPAWKARWLLPALLVPALDHICLAYAGDRAVCLATITAIAATRYHLAEGRWPEAAETLVPRYLAEVPMDPWAEGAPVHFAQDGLGFRIWSLGRDGTDERGDLTARSPTGAVANSVDAGKSMKTPVDWVWFAPRGNLSRWVEPPPTAATYETQE